MKRIILSLCVLAILLCCSRGMFGEQRYICDVAQVDSIQIVRLDKYIAGEYRYEYTILSEIADSETFVGNLNKLDHSVNWGDPRQMDEGYVVIKIDYRNGDFDLIHPDAQCFNRSGVNQYGYFFFDDAQFHSLLTDYIEG